MGKIRKSGQNTAFSVVPALLLSLFVLAACAAGSPSVSDGSLLNSADSADPEPQISTVSIAVAAPAALWVEPAEANGIPARIDVFRAVHENGASEPDHTYQLYLPGNADPEACYLSWDGDMQAVIDGVAYDSGACPIPSSAAGNLNTVSETIAFIESGEPSAGSRPTASGEPSADSRPTAPGEPASPGAPSAAISLATYRGSANVQPVFIEIDENNGTIAAMNDDEAHETSCSGRISIGGNWYTLSKIKGRGNVTWKKAKDKRPYNVTLESRIHFPGIDSPETKSWSFLAEVFDHSLLCNRVGFSLAHEMGIGQDTSSADVWMNGEYLGCYTVTPKTDSFASDEGYMVEQDNYQEPPDGDPQFSLEGLMEADSGISRFNRITVKKIGSSVLADRSEEEAVREIREWLQDALDAILSDDGFNAKGKHYTDYIDSESFARMYLVHEYVKSYDICAGSILFRRDGQGDDDKLVAGPIWDLDNALGSTHQNPGLGDADDQEHGDRRSGEGDFIPNVREYKTSIYKNLGKHDDFMEEVLRQYKLCRSAFEELPDVVPDLADEIAASARMNHIKVIDLTQAAPDQSKSAYLNSICNDHIYWEGTTLGSGEYEQHYLATTDARTDWDHYVANLATYVTARSRWFRERYADAPEE